MTFREQLRKYIRAAFDNEKEFIDLFLPGGVDEVSEVYMASRQTRVAFVANNGMEMSTTISTCDFIAWTESKTKGE